MTRARTPTRAVLPSRAVASSRATTPNRATTPRAADPPDLRELREYQVLGVRFLREHDRALLADMMALGKTAQVLRAMPSRARAIVVMPASLVGEWGNPDPRYGQVARWRPDLHVTTADGLRGPDGRVRLRRPEPGEIIAISYGSLPDPLPGSSVLTRDSLRDVTLVLEECHRVKTEDALCTQRVRMLAQRGACEVVHGLSATPMPNEPPDLWGVLASIGLAERLFGSRERFVELCGGKRRRRWDRKLGREVEAGWEWGTVSDEVRAAVATVMLRRTREEVCLELPEVQRVTIHVDAPDDLRPYLDSVKAQWDEIDPTRLPPFELLSEARAALARSRGPAARDWAEDAISQGIQAIVFSDHVAPLRMVAGLEGAELFVGPTPQTERDRIVARFRSGETRVLAMSIDAGGVGLNLPQASAELFVDQHWNPSENDQAEARAVRPGGHESVLVARMMSTHPLDVRLCERLDVKRQWQREAGLG